jgi:pyruvate/2-oxoglutarate dehydrogenase complex dihydrolipoamide dehydrogenase (E3) component
MNTIYADLCIIGAGSGGLSVAAGAVQMGASVVLIENHKMGGDCLNYGCVPSKATISVARTADKMRHADKFNLTSVAPKVDYKELAAYVTSVIAQIAPNDSVARFTELGVNVLQGTGKFIDAKTVQVGQTVVKGRRFVIATGSTAAIPPIPGLDQTPYLTNETIFALEQTPAQLIVIGGGPIGCELAQAHLMLGTKVTLLEGFKILPKDDSEATQVVREQLLQQGLDLHEGIKVLQTRKTDSGIEVTIEADGAEKVIQGSHLLIAAGRKPNLANLALEKANIDFHPRGINVDDRLRTSNKKVFAIGDTAGSFQFTHAAGYHAGIVIRNALFHLPAKVNYRAMPWVTYTTPELAHVGLNEDMATEQGTNYETISWPFKENDRAIAENDTAGFIKILLGKKGLILGVTIVGPHAGELITTYVLAINKGLKIKDLADMIVPYPTLAEVGKRAAGKYYLPLISSPRMKKIVRFLQKF